jgi:hypothetical protein
VWCTHLFMPGQLRSLGGRGRAALFDDYRGSMSTSSGPRPLRTVLLIAAAVATALAIRAALADKGGSYDPAGSPR